MAETPSSSNDNGCIYNLRGVPEVKSLRVLLRRCSTDSAFSLRTSYILASSMLLRRHDLNVLRAQNSVGLLSYYTINRSGGVSIEDLG